VNILRNVIEAPESNPQIAPIAQIRTPMEETARSSLTAWESFYVIVGSAGAALTGLQFVVMALIADSRRQSSSVEHETGERTIAAFSTPTIVHFCAVLVVSAIVSAPWPTLSYFALLIGACGIGGMMYGLFVIRLARKQTAYHPVFEDWLWHSVLPLFAYALLLTSAITVHAHPVRVLFVIAATTLLLLLIGIHNAWDTIAYIATGGPDASKESTHAEERGGSLRRRRKRK
jgi:hypothetical protein